MPLSSHSHFFGNPTRKVPVHIFIEFCVIIQGVSLEWNSFDSFDTPFPSHWKLSICLGPLIQWVSTLVFRLSNCLHLKCSGKLINIIYFHFLHFFFSNIGDWELHGLTTYHQYNFVCCISISAWLCGGFFIILPIRGTGVYAHHTAINISLLILRPCYIIMLFVFYT